MKNECEMTKTKTGLLWSVKARSTDKDDEEDNGNEDDGGEAFQGQFDVRVVQQVMYTTDVYIKNSKYF
jgi:hypothetical protein